MLAGASAAAGLDAEMAGLSARMAVWGDIVGR